MIKVECVSCKSPYDVDERRIPATGMKMRCPKCSTSFVIGKDGSTSLPASQPPAAGPAPGKPNAAPASAFAKPAGGAFGDVKPAAAQPSAASAFGAAKPAVGAPAAGGGGMNLKKTLLGAATADQPGTPAKPDGATMLGVAAPGAGSNADLPAVKPQAKPAVPWGSLAPPGPESKVPPPMRPQAGPNLPKGAMGVPSQPPLAAAAAAISQKSVTTASAFGSSAAKQTLLGHVRGQGGQELALNSAAAAQPAEPDASELPFVDLPAPKPVAASVFGANTNAAAPKQAERPLSEPSIDLPAAKPMAAKPFAPPPKAAALEVDLPAPKPGAAKPAFGAPLAPPPAKAAVPEVDLPAPKPGAAKAAFGAPLAPPPPKAAALEVDLPAPKPAVGVPVAPPGKALAPDVDLPAPKPAAAKLGFGAPLAPPPPKAAALEMDLPAPKAAPAAPGKALAPDVDLPAPKPAAAKPGFGAPPAPPPGKALAPDVDLPAPKPAAAKPGFGAPPPKAAALEVDLPAPKPGAAKAAFGAPLAPSLPPSAANDDLVDLPVPAAARDKVGVMPKPPARASELPSIDLDLPALKETDLPTLKKGGPSFGEVDLPTPKGSVDLPAPKPSPAQIGEMDLPAPKTIADLPAPRGIADLPAPLGVTDLPSPQRQGFGDLDLPIPKAFAPLGDDEASFGSLDLPGGRPDSSNFGDIELPPPRAAADLVPPKARTFQGVGIPGREDESSFGNLELGSPIPPYPDDEMRLDDVRPDDLLQLKDSGPAGPMDLGSLPPALRGGVGDGDDFGEAGLEAPDDSMEFGIAEGEGEGFALPPEILRRQRGEDLETPQADKSKRAVHVLVGVALLLVLVGGAGAALGFTDYGFFGIYVLEQYLPEAANAKFAREAIERAEKSAASDTYKGVRGGLNVLGEARRGAGLNRELLTRSLLHESLYLLRFGTDTGSSAHVAAIMRRLDERHGIAPGMALARAADAARRGDNREAEARLGEALGQDANDAYAHLLAGEVSLRQGKFAEAEKSFRQALKHGGAARAQWGIARVALARPDEAAQQAAIEETLKLSPLHAEARIAQARSLFRQGKEERAVQELRQALGLEAMEDQQFLHSSKPAKAQGLSLLGHIHEQRGRLHLARKAYEDSLAADPYLVEALLGSGRVLIRERRFNDALARFESGLTVAAKAPNSVMLSGRKAEDEARLGQSRAQLALGRAPEAKANLTQLASASPNDPEITLAMGQAEEVLGNKESAESLFRRAIELAPTSFSGYLALSQYYFKQSQPDKASETLNDAASKVEENAEMRRMLGQSELARNHLESAVHEFKRAIELDATDLDARFGLAISYRRLEQLDEARVLFDQIAQRDPQYAGLTLERGQLLEAQGDYDKAIENYRNALKKDANDTALSLRLGAAQVEGGKLDDAEQTLDKVIHQIPNSADAEYYIGRVAFARGRGPDALTHFDRALALDNTQAVYHLYAARAALEMNNLGRTLEEAELALARDQKLGDAYWVRGVVRVRSGLVKDALKDAMRALELKPSRIEAQALLAECYDELRQLAQSIAAYKVALDRDPARGEWWYKLSRVYLDQGARGDANAALERAIKLGDGQDPAPYWLAESYRLIGDNARATNNRKAAVAAYKRYLALAPHGALDRPEVTKLLRDWNVELE